MASPPTSSSLPPNPNPTLDFPTAISHIRSGQSIDTTTTQLIGSLTTAEKLSMLTGPTTFWPGIKDLMRGSMNEAPYMLGAIPRLSIPGIRFCDGPRGVVLGKATCFPVAIARGATWDTALEERVGEAMALEARALGANCSGAVCINLPRHPAWGRIQETYAEDPVLVGEMGMAVTRALQRGGVMACVKHFALNSIEDTRFKVDVRVEGDVLREVFLPHFEMCVAEAGALCVMSAYNAVNGEWCGQNEMLLGQVLRKEWAFEYFVVSDWVFGLRDSVKSLKAGLDLEAPFRQVRAQMQRELDDGEITMEEVERSVGRLVRAQLKLYSERSDTEPDKSVVLSQKHRDLAREVAARSMVLLKNEPVGEEDEGDARKPLLPVDIAKVKKCAVIGQLANALNTGDWGSSFVTSPHVITPYEGMKSALSAHGATVSLTETDDVHKAVDAAKGADLVVVVVGYGASDEGENLNASTPMSLIPFPSLIQLLRDVPQVLWQQVKERLGFHGQGPSLGGKAGGDRKNLHLSSKNVDLIRSVTKANSRTVVAIVASGAIIMEDWIDEVDTVLINWYSGCEGGDALADVIFGRVDASGRLPFSIPKDEADLPFFDANATSITYDKWFGHRLLDIRGLTARFPLGYGRSYTAFKMEQLTVEDGTNGEFLKVQVKLTNTGGRAGRHVVQVYGCPANPGSDFPTRVLMGFAPVELPTGETKLVEIKARTRPLKRWHEGNWVYASNDIEIEVGSHVGDRALTHKICLE